MDISLFISWFHTLYALQVFQVFVEPVNKKPGFGEEPVMYLLHGTISVNINGADLVYAPNSAIGCLQRFFPKVVGSQMLAKNRWAKIKNTFLCRQQVVGELEKTAGLTQLYATIDLDKARVGRTRMITDEAIKPQWNEHFEIYCAHSVSNIIFTVKDDNSIGATLIGRAYLPVEEIQYVNQVDKWLEIKDVDGEPVNEGAKIHVTLRYLDVTKDPNWSRGISPDFHGVPRTFFHHHDRCRVSLYQDAHIPDKYLPRIPLSGGRYYEPRRCWEDIFDAISNARHLIYITGWSVNTNITLVRDLMRSKPGGDITLGELLKKKANEGVAVLMLVWDDRTSFSLTKRSGVALLKEDGLMGTNDQETANFFKGTAVNCVLCPRNPDGGKSIFQDIEVSTMFTHHQKIVVVDDEMPNRGGSQQRRIVSFIGGIDLCDGRYDTPSHSLFRTLDTVHRNDFHQPNFTGGGIKKGGPREPWHDIHCKLEGAIAGDVLKNFEQRWLRQGTKKELLFHLKRTDLIVTDVPASNSEDSETWNVQLFRSIDGGAVHFPQNPGEAAKVGLVTGKDNVIDRSIQDAYINAIRRAKNFIYIENQYFLGSSFDWKPDGRLKVENINEINALHLIPKELSLKIVSKIKAGERFAVYVVVPMWPEGIPESDSVQAILDWQKRTMDMMYTDITKALREINIQADPKDYLSFFCLGNRELKKMGEYIPTEQPKPDTDYSRAQQSRRFMIYVHAKMMIVDDEYIIIGSANINERSMNGARDTEIAMGAYQPHHLYPSRGQIHGFRMALWFEHLGKVFEHYHTSFLEPQSLECVRRVKEIADRNWNIYASDSLTDDLPGHLLSYPIQVTSTGMVQNLQGLKFFPDTNANILGHLSDKLPAILTT